MVAAAAAFAEDGQKPPRHIDWPFSGIFGNVDKQAAQRGFQVYKEVCSACHPLTHIAFRNLEDIGFSEAEVKVLASSYQIADGPNDSGDMFQRPGKPSDYFPSPYANDEAGRALHNGALPPDLSLIIKARKNGPDYVYSLLTGFSPPPAGVMLTAGQNYNPYFPGGKLMMPPPLTEGQVTYTDGTPASVDQMTRDVVVFLQWAAEPEMEERKEMGIKALVYLAIFTIFMYLAKRNLWRKLH
ncbi:MAG: cytochrome c1 [Pseudomonadota bacterium]|nr:cytochrome c1 [Pseudomonadota bacterium]MDE3038863.1 cytochrome c1 [Pseudomonadota bacterium]